MFAGDTESVFSVDTVTPTAPLPTPLLCSSSNPIRRSNSQAPKKTSDPMDEIEERVRRVSVREEEFGWSGSAGGIRGRDDRQIERDAEYERKMEERRRRRHERKLARKHQACPPPSYTSTRTSTPAPRRVTVASSLPPIIDAPAVGTTTETSPPRVALSRGKSLRERVGAALTRFHSHTATTPSASRRHSQNPTPPTAQPPIPLKRTQSLSAQHARHHPSSAQAPPVALNRSLTGLVRKFSRKISTDDRRNLTQPEYAAPPTLSHTLVGPASPFPMRPPLSALVGSVPAYNEAHNPHSLDPVRRGPYRRTQPDQIRAR